MSRRAVLLKDVIITVFIQLWLSQFSNIFHGLMNKPILRCTDVWTSHSVLVIKTSQLILYKEVSVVCSQIHTKHVNTFCGQNVELLNSKPGDTCSDHWALKG